MAQVELSLQGMSCGNCVAHVRKALDALPGVQPDSVEVGRAVVSYDPDQADLARIQAVLEDEGYPARPLTGA